MRNTFDKRIAFVFVLGLVLGLSQIAGAEVFRSNLITPLAANVYDPCMKEDIFFSGNIHTVVITVTAACKDDPTCVPITNIKLLSNYQGVTGVGQETGQTYQLSNSSNTNLIQRPVEGGGLETVNYTEHELGRLASNSALFSFKSHYTVKPNGDVIASFTDFEVKCTGQTVGETPDESGACFDGIDNDGDGFSDCADPDCAGAVGGPCSTDICLRGTLQCVSSVLVCMPGPDCVIP